MPTKAAPFRASAHDSLSAFLGEWRAEGMSFGGTDQSGADPKANGVPWISTHSAHWHTGEFFLVQDERAQIGGTPFDTISIMGVEPRDKGHFARTFENHGFYRHYALSVDNRTWMLEGETERARTVFNADGNTQTIKWEWLRDGKWLPLCDRVATRIEQGGGVITSATTDTAKAIFDAYIAKDRAAAERLIADDFRFTSPLDNGLDRDSYFAICWPNSKNTEGFEFVHMVEDGERVFVTYEGQSKQSRFRNTEILTVRDGQIAKVEVYFGWNVPHDVTVGQHRDPE